MKENFSNLVRETDFQKVQEAQRVLKKLDPKKNTPRYIIIKLPKIKDKERMLNAARAKERVTYKEVPIRLSADFSKEIKFPGGLVVRIRHSLSQKKPCKQEGAGKKYSNS